MGTGRIPRRSAPRGQGLAWCLEGFKVIMAKAQTVGRLRPKGKLRRVGTLGWLLPQFTRCSGATRLQGAAGRSHSLFSGPHVPPALEPLVRLERARHLR